MANHKKPQPAESTRTYLTRSLKAGLHARMRVLSLQRLRTLEEIVNDALTIGVAQMERESQK